MPDDRETWKEIALWLATCHAATAEHEGTLRRTSKHSKVRLASICEKAATMLESQTATYAGGVGIDHTVERLRNACRTIEREG